jgi:hypothetical protein
VRARRNVRWGYVGLVSVLTAMTGALSLVQPAAAAEKSAPSEMTAAFVKAKRQNAPVIVATLTAPGRTVSVQPNGTLTAELSASDTLLDTQAVGLNGWANVFHGKPASTHWNGANDQDALGKVGACNFAGCGDIGVARTYLQFDTGFLAGARILQASLGATIVHSPSCSVRNHNLYRAVAPISSDTSWNNAPSGWLVGMAGAAGAYVAGCAGNKNIGWNVTGQLNTDGLSTFFIAAQDETDTMAWRKYDAAATTVVVTYDVV